MSRQFSKKESLLDTHYSYKTKEKKWDIQHEVTLIITLPVNTIFIRAQSRSVPDEKVKIVLHCRSRLKVCFIDNFSLVISPLKTNVFFKNGQYTVIITFSASADIHLEWALIWLVCAQFPPMVIPFTHCSLILHFLSNFMRIQNARNRHLHPPLVILSSLESCFPFLQEEIRVILSGELSDLNQEVS